MTDWDQLWTAEPGSFHHFPSEDLVRWASGVGGGRVLEVGCGAGQNVRALWKLGFEAYGVDVSSAAVIHARTINPEIHEFFQVADVCSLPFADGFFYAVADVQCLQHVEDIALAYKEIYRVLDDQCGRIFTMHLYAGQEHYPGLRFTNPHDDALTDAGFKIVSRGGKSRSWDDETVSWRLRVCEKA